MKTVFAGIIIALSAGAAIAEQIDTSDIVTAVVGDWNQDGAQDLALLMRGSEDMDLRFFVQDKDGGYLRDAGVARNKIWGNAGPDSMMGNAPELIAMPNGSLRITSQNAAVGRDRWSQTLTLAYRNNDFVVAGLTYSYYDTLEPDNNGDCDVNILTGKGMANKPDGKGGHIRLTIAAAPEFVTFQNWPDDSVNRICGIGG